MSTEAAQIGILASDRDLRIELRRLVSSADVGTVLVEAEDYPTSLDDISLALWRQASPNVILVASSDPNELVPTVATLHQALPRAWIFAVSNIEITEVVLSTIRAGASEFLHIPVSLKSIRDAMHRLSKEQQRDVVTKPYGKTYGLMSPKGGIGTTTIAVNLAASMATRPGANVAVIDFGYPLGDAAALLDVRPPFTIVDAFNLSSRLDSVLLESYMVQKHGVSLLAGPNEVSTKGWPSQESFQRTLRVVAETFTHAFVDIPSSVSLDHLATLVRLCDEFVTIVSAELAALWRTHRFLAYMRRWDAASKTRLLVNKYDNNGDITLKEVEQSLGLEAAWTLPYDRNLAARAVHSGKPIVKLGNSALAEGFEILARELSGLTIEKKKPGFLSSLFGRTGESNGNSEKSRSHTFNLLKDARDTSSVSGH